MKQKKGNGITLMFSKNITTKGIANIQIMIFYKQWIEDDKKTNSVSYLIIIFNDKGDKNKHKTETEIWNTHLNIH